MTSYLKSFSIFLLLLILSFSFFSWFIDPFSIWHSHCYKNISCKKTEAGKKIYLTKAHQWKRTSPEVIILGNSRSEIGIDPSFSEFNDTNVYNLSIRGASTTDQAVYLVNLLQMHQPSHIILGIDFFSFRQDSSITTTWPPIISENSKYNNLRYTISGEINPFYFTHNIKNHLNSLLSLDSLLASIKTIINQNRNVNYLLPNGFNQANAFIPIIENEGIASAFKHDEQLLLEKLSGKSFVLRDANNQSPSFSSLKLLIDLINKRNIKLNIYVNPVHINYLDILQKTGNFELYLSWKKELVSALNDLNYFNNSLLLDFSGFNEFTLEEIPKKKNNFMNWFLEPAHYTPKLGVKIISHIFNKNDRFELNNKNILIRIQKEREMMIQRTKIKQTYD